MSSRHQTFDWYLVQPWIMPCSPLTAPTWPWWRSLYRDRALVVHCGEHGQGLCGFGDGHVGFGSGPQGGGGGLAGFLLPSCTVVRCSDGVGWNRTPCGTLDRNETRSPHYDTITHRSFRSMFGQYADERQR